MYWLISANPKYYKHFEAFQENTFIDWNQVGNYSVGDIVYIYTAKPYQRISFKTVVEKIDIPSEFAFDDSKYWIDISMNESRKKRMRLRLLDSYDSDELSYDSLKTHGLKTAVQGKIGLKGELLTYIQSVTNNLQTKRRVLFCNVAYMKFYDDRIKDDIPKNGGKYVDEHGDAFETNNFKECEDGYCRGWVETKHKNDYEIGNLTNTFNELHIENIDSLYKNKDEIDNVFVVFCAKKDNLGTVVVGWYKNATVYRYRPLYETENRQYNIIAKNKNCFLIPHEERNFVIPRAKKGVFGFGQSNVRFADYDNYEDSINKILNYIDNYYIDDNLVVTEEHEEEYIENGKGKKIYSTTYERNSKARKACLRKYGYKCQICGFDSQLVYGEEFKNKIHVHHIVPIHEIKSEYQIDPEKDLIPVCPNCHMILHSKKKDGTYPSVKELKSRFVFK